MEFIESVANLVTKNEETAWQKASASLDASAKIYGFRVDSVHSETFKILGGLNRNEKNDINDDIISENNEKKEKERKNHNGGNTIENNHEKLNLTKYDLEFDIDPLFKSMTAKFNESGAKSLLLNTLPLDENLDVLLESKPEKKIIKRNFDNENNDIVLPIEKKYLNEFGYVTCSINYNDLSETCLKITENFKNSMSVDELINLKICPELSIFKERSKLDSSNNGNLMNSFLNNFKEELDKNDEENFDEINEEIIIKEEEDNLLQDDNINDINDNISIVSQNKSLDMESQLNDNRNNITNNISNIGNYNGENNFSMFNQDELLNQLNQFGDGRKDVLKDLPQFQNFVKNFNKLDKNLFFNKFGIKNEEGNKKKKEEKLFVFNINNEIEKNEIFTENKTKATKKPEIPKRDNKKKLKLFFNFDKFSIFKLFTGPDRTIFFRGQNNNIVNNNYINNNNEFENSQFGIDENIDITNINLNNTNGENTFVKFDEEYEKKYGQLYKRFDIRFLKNKIWESFENIEKKIEERKSKNNNQNDNNEIIDFKNIVTNMSSNIDDNTLNNISTSTCFVCMLHLCNEKNLLLKQNDDTTFYVETDINEGNIKS